VRDSPDGSLRRHDAVTLRQAGRDLRSAWQHPGTRLGLWTHFTTQFSGTVFALLWGYPFLVSGEGLSRGSASALFTLLVLVGALAAPFLGVMVQRHPLRRSWLVLSIVGLNITAWTVVLSWPGRAVGAVPGLGRRHRGHPHDPPQGAGPAGPRRRRRATDPRGHRPPPRSLTAARSSPNIAASAGGW
jgi:hypothetical protein